MSSNRLNLFLDSWSSGKGCNGRFSTTELLSSAVVGPEEGTDGFEIVEILLTSALALLEEVLVIAIDTPAVCVPKWSD